MFPGLRSDVFLQDLIKKKYKMKDEKTGKRLNGTAPYKHDPTIPEQIAYTWTLLEASKAPLVVLLGSKVRKEFVARYGKFKNGDWIVVGGRYKQVFHIRHPEHTMKYATVAELKELKATLREVDLVGFESEIGFAWLDELIQQRGKQPPLKEDPIKPEVTLAPREEVKKLCKVVHSCVASTKRKVYIFKTDQTGRYEKLACKIEELRKDPNGPYSKNSQIMRAIRSDPNGAWKNQAGKMKAHHANPTGSFQFHGQKIKAALQAKKASGDREMWDKTVYTKLQQRVTQEVRWTRSGPAAFNLSAWLKEKRFNIAPRARDLTHDEVLYYLPGALAFTGHEVPKDLPRSNTASIGKHKAHWMVDVTFKKDLFVSELLHRNYPTFFMLQERDTHFGGANPSAHVSGWERRWRFAEDLIGFAQEQGLQGVKDILFERKVEHWPA